MKVTMTGRQMEVPKDLKEIFEKKLRKFDRFFGEDTAAQVKLSRKRNLECVEVTISSGGIIYRAEKDSETFNNALDECVDALERQLRKNKTRLEKRLREGAFRDIPDQESAEEEKEFSIRVKSFALKPMSPEEAIMQMNLLDHEFYVFENVDTGRVNVVYKRKDEAYGLIQPE